MLMARSTLVAHLQEDCSGRDFANGGSPVSNSIRNWCQANPSARIHFFDMHLEPGTRRLHVFIIYEATQ